MKTTRRSILHAVGGAVGSALLRPWAVAAEETDGARLERPHLLVTARKVKGFRSVEELHESRNNGHGRVDRHCVRGF